MLTICIDVTAVLPGGENGGAKPFVLELISGLARMAPKAEFVLLTRASSHQELATLDRGNLRRVTLVGAPDPGAGIDDARSRSGTLGSRLPGVVRRRFAQGAYHVSRRLKRLGRRRILSRIGADLLFCPFTAPVFSVRNVPTVCTIYDLQFADYPQFFEPEDRAHRRGAFVDACGRAAMLVAISDCTRASAIACGRLAPDRITTIALRMKQRPPPSATRAAEVLDRLGLVARNYLLYPANFWRHKNHEMLLAAFGMACARGLPPDTMLVCTGVPGARRDFVRSAAAAFGLAHRVAFPGYLGDGEFTTVLASAGGLIFPSLYEGFGMPVVEAMAAGVPVACSDATSLPEVAGDAALLFDPRRPDAIAQALLDLVLDHPLRLRLIEAGYRRAVHFSDADRMILEYLGVFEQVLRGRREPWR